MHTHRDHAIIEAVIADLKDCPLAHAPSGKFNANAAWLALASIAFNLTRAAARLASQTLGKARTATVRRTLIQVAGRIANQARRWRLHLPTLDPEAEPARHNFREDKPGRRGRDARDSRDGDEGGGRSPRGGGGQRETPTGLASYRIAVGRRHKVAPRQIVGALANEGGLQRGDFGKIDIRADHSLVELPAQLPQAVWDALRPTRILGQLIQLEADRGRPQRKDRDKRRPRD